MKNILGLGLFRCVAASPYYTYHYSVLAGKPALLRAQVVKLLYEKGFGEMGKTREAKLLWRSSASLVAANNFGAALYRPPVPKGKKLRREGRREGGREGGTGRWSGGCMNRLLRGVVGGRIVGSPDKKMGRRGHI
jgi:hypothetical protein